MGEEGVMCAKPISSQELPDRTDPSKALKERALLGTKENPLTLEDVMKYIELIERNNAPSMPEDQSPKGHWVCTKHEEYRESYAAAWVRYYNEKGITLDTVPEKDRERCGKVMKWVER
jgi:hypothetical protein